MPTDRAAYSQYALPETLPNIRITPDDDEIMLELYRHSIVDAHTFRLAMPHRSKEHLGRRLNTLRKGSYILRLPQLEQLFVPGGGSYPKAYVLGDRGASHLREKFKLPSKRRRDDKRISGWSPTRLPHELDVSRFMVQLRQSAATHDGIEYLHPDEYYKEYAPQILKDDSLPRTVKAKVRWHGYNEEAGTNYDGFGILRYTTRDSGKNKRALFVEIDEGFETINPSDEKIKTLKFWKDTSVLRKNVVYGYAYKTNRHRKDFGLETFQVLFVTTTPERAKEMQATWRARLAGRPHSVHPNRLLYTDFQTIEKHEGDILSVPILNAAGEVHSIAP